MVLDVANDVRVLRSLSSWHKRRVCMLLQFGTAQDLKVLHGDLDFEVVSLIDKKLQVGLLLGFGQGNFLFAFFDPRQFHF